jgi:spore coat protein A
MYIDGISLGLGRTCINSTFKIGGVYDFYIINLTPDAHPIHFHLINFQKIKRFPINVEAYT